MAMSQQDAKYFQTVYAGEIDFDTERFLTEVQNLFGSETIQQEVAWRIQVLRDIASQDDLNDVCDALRNALSRVFSEHQSESAVLAALKALTEVEREDGQAVDLRRFQKRARRTLTEDEYREFLAKKLENTLYQIDNLGLFYPDALPMLEGLKGPTGQLEGQIRDPGIPVKQVAAAERQIRDGASFQHYESLKVRFLRDWLTQFTNVDPAEAANLSPAELQQLVATTQRHQLTQLLKAEVTLPDMDMSEHLSLHDTLEGNFKDEVFWERANQGMRNGFRHWILGAIQSFGIPRGRRYVMAQRKTDDSQLLLFGMGVDTLGDDVESLTLVPYLKPFTRKSGYLLEIRRRDLGTDEEYHQQLRHAVMPFLYAFDQMRDFKVSRDLVSFFTSAYQSH